MDLYAVLEVELSASTGDIKRAYRRLALKYHPDKAAEHERADAEIRFKEISQAYEILSDDDKRLHYDLYGTVDDPLGAGNGHYSSHPFGDEPGGYYGADDFYNFFSNMNGGPPGGADRAAANRTPDAELAVDVTLEVLFQGKTVKLTLTRNVVCGTCHGLGARKRAAARPCVPCDGHGYTTKIKRVGPGLVSQVHVDCDACGGLGKAVRHKDRCKACLGHKVVEELKILEFEIAPGLALGESVVLKGEADQYPGKTTGDVVLTFHCKPHACFTRKGNDLYMRYDISLVDALGGFSRVIAKHLDGRALRLTTPRGKVLRPGDHICIAGEGMPVKKAGWFGPLRGNLYVAVGIDFPPDNWYLEKNDLVKLRNLFPEDVDAAVKQRQTVETDSLPEANIQDVTDFSVVATANLPKYDADRTPEPEAARGVDAECTQQ